MAFNYYAYELNKADGTDLALKITGATTASRWVSITPEQRDRIAMILNEPEYGACHVCQRDAMECYNSPCS